MYLSFNFSWNQPQPTTKRKRTNDAENSDDAAGTSHSPQPNTKRTKRKRTNDAENSDDAALLLTNLFERKNTFLFKSKERDDTGCFEGKDHEGLSWRRYCQYRWSLMFVCLFVWCLTTHQPLWVISVKRY